MKPALYIETSVVGYYTGRPSRDLIIAGRQQITRDWWENERQKYSLHVSALVLQESQRGEPEAIKRREQALKGIPLLGTTDQSGELAEALVKDGPIPAEYLEDALHIALASTNGMGFLLTWNLRHINNARMKSDVMRIYDLKNICADLRRIEKQSVRRVVTRKPKRCAETTGKSSQKG